MMSTANILYIEAATGSVLQEQVFLKISQISQETPVLESLFNLAALSKRDFLRTSILKNICERLLLYVVFNFNSWSVGVLGLGASEYFLNILDWKKLFSICWSSLAQNIIIITNIIIIIFSSFAIMSAFPFA